MTTYDTPVEESPSFWRRRSVRRMILGLTALLGVIVFGMVGYMLRGWTAADALYMVVITVTTVGYGEVNPLNTAGERLHTMLVIALGTVAVAYTIGNLIAFITEGEIKYVLGHQRVRRQIEELSGHIVVAGYGRMGGLLCAELAAVGERFVLIDRADDRVAEFERQGILYVLGDATDEKVLEEAGITRARALVSTVPSDADCLFLTLSARQMAPKILIVARAEQPSTQNKLRLAGADHVVLPASIGAHRIASLLTNPEAVEFAELVTQRASLAIQMEEVPVLKPGPFFGLTLRNADIGRRTGVIVIAIKRSDGSLEFPPTGDIPFTEGDRIVLIGRRQNLDQFRAAFQY